MLRVIAGAGLKPTVDRLPIASTCLRLGAAGLKGGGPVECQLRFGADSYTVRIPEGAGLDALRIVWRNVAVEAARQSVAARRLFEAQQILADVCAENGTDEAVETLLRACKPVVETVVDYHGGHPRFTDQIRGVLRFDDQGVEFTPSLAGAAGYMRIPYAEVVEVSPPAVGEVPEEILSSHASKQATGAALSIAATLLGGGQAGRAVGRGMRPDQAAIKPPKNRLGLSIRSEGTIYKLFFDTAGSDRSALEKTAKDFWAATATVRGRFSKKPGGSARAPAPGSAGAAATNGGVSSAELRELLLLCLDLQLTGEVSQGLINSGRFTAEQIDERRSRAITRLGDVLSTPSSPPATRGGVAGAGTGGVADEMTVTPADDTKRPPGAATSSGRMSTATAAAIGLGVGVLAAGAASVAMAGGSSHAGVGEDGAGEPLLIDLDHDGDVDGVAVDTDGDGTLDTVGVDRDGDGAVDAVAVDTDGDGRVDAVGTDTDGDGDIDAVAVDADGDGDVDAVALDTDNDGAADMAGIDDDGDGDLDAVAMDTDDDGVADTFAVDDDTDDDAMSVYEVDDEVDEDYADDGDDGDDDFDFDV